MATTNIDFKKVLKTLTDNELIDLTVVMHSEMSARFLVMTNDTIEKRRKING